MNDPLPLFSHTPPYQPHSATSRAAAERIESAAGTLRGKVLQFLQDSPRGATDKEIQDALAMAGSTQRPRRIELVADGLVRDSGVRRNRSTVWVAACR